MTIFEKMINIVRKDTFTSTVTKDGDNDFYPIDFVNDFSGNKYLKDFLEIPELNAILNIRARALSSAKFKIISKTTGKELNNNEPLVKILRAPNWFQGQREFIRQTSLYRDIYGNEYMYFLTPVGMPNSYKGLFTLDPYKVWIKYNSENFYFMETSGMVMYQYKESGKTINIPAENIIHLNDNRVVSTNFMGADQFVRSDSFLKGTSKLKALQPALNNIRDAYKKRGISLNMPIGIMSNAQSDAIGQAVPMNPTEKKKTQRQIEKHGAFPILTNLAVKYDSMNITAKSMGLFEETRESTGRICDSFGVPYELLASQKGVTFSNLAEAKKQFYNDTVIPDMDERMNAINSRFATKSWEIKADFSENHVFDIDLNNKSQAINALVSALNIALQANVITVAQFQDELRKYDIG